jgi:hypothetical protein
MPLCAIDADISPSLSRVEVRCCSIKDVVHKQKG